MCRRLKLVPITVKAVTMVGTGMARLHMDVVIPEQVDRVICLTPQRVVAVLDGLNESLAIPGFGLLVFGNVDLDSAGTIENSRPIHHISGWDGS